MELVTIYDQKQIATKVEQNQWAIRFTNMKIKRHKLRKFFQYYDCIVPARIDFSVNAPAVSKSVFSSPETL
jgi:hypothetical protein